MKEGLLLYDPDGMLEERVGRAVEAYSTKTGLLPDVCLVNESDVDGDVVLSDVVVMSNKYVQPGHLWIGLEDGE